MMKNYTEFLSENHLKNTAARRVLFEVALSQRGHFTVDDFLAAAQKKESSIGLATVYRFLGVLIKSRILSERNFGEKTLFEVKRPDEHHDHLICEQCGKVVEFTSPEIEYLQDSIVKKYGFLLTQHRHELYGICQGCQEKF